MVKLLLNTKIYGYKCPSGYPAWKLYCNKFNKWAVDQNWQFYLISKHLSVNEATSESMSLFTSPVSVVAAQRYPLQTKYKDTTV